MTCTTTTQTTGIGSCISTTCADIIDNSLPTKSAMQNTNGTNRGKNSSVISTKMMQSCALICKNDIKKHTAITQSGKSKSIGGKNTIQIRQLISKLCFVSTKYFRPMVTKLENRLATPANIVFRYKFPPMYFV